MMPFTEAVKTCLSRYATVRGRATRSEFWWFTLFEFIVFFVAAMINEYVAYAAVVALLLPNLAVGVRRLHDIGKSGWFLLIGFIPVLGPLLLLWWYVQPSDVGANVYGGRDVTPYSTTFMPNQ